MLHICHSNSFGWCNRCISIERWRSLHNPRSHHRSKIFSSSRTFFRFCFPRLVSRNHHSDHLELLQGMHLNGIAAQASDLRSHSAVFPIAKSFHRSSSIPGWCNGCNLTKRPIFWCCWPSRSKIASGAFSRPGTWMELLEPISCASTRARHPSDDSATCPRGLHLNKMPQSLVQPPPPLPRLPLCPSPCLPPCPNVHLHLKDCISTERCNHRPRRSEIATTPAIFTIYNIKGFRSWNLSVDEQLPKIYQGRWTKGFFLISCTHIKSTPVGFIPQSLWTWQSLSGCTLVDAQMHMAHWPMEGTLHLNRKYPVWTPPF